MIVKNLATPNAVAKLEIWYCQLARTEGLLRVKVTLRQDNIEIVTPEAVAKLELLLNKQNVLRKWINSPELKRKYNRE
jgi:hypothetical protein